MQEMNSTREGRRRSRSLVAGLLLLAAATASAAAAAAATAAATAGGPATPARDGSRAAALAAFDTVRAVLQHPRCQNCHIPGDAPLQFDAGIAHAQHVQRGPEGNGVPGLPCSTCHAASNPPASYGAHVPPGAPNWRLPSPRQKMVFIGLPPAALCATIKDRQRTGGRDLAAMLDHVSHDKLVAWGWDPGVGRAPVSIPHDVFVASFKTWIEGGAPCPGP
jgi:hypothetical protein